MGKKRRERPIHWESVHDGHFTSSVNNQPIPVSDLQTFFRFSDIAKDDDHPIILANRNGILFKTVTADKGGIGKRSFKLQKLDEVKFEVNAGGIHGIEDGDLFRFAEVDGMRDSLAVLQVETPQSLRLHFGPNRFSTC